MDGRHETPNGSGDSGDFATHFTNEVTQIVTACKGLSRDFTQYNKFTLSELRVRNLEILEIYGKQ